MELFKNSNRNQQSLWINLLGYETLYKEWDSGFMTKDTDFISCQVFTFCFWVGEEMCYDSIRKQLQKCGLGENESVLKQGMRNLTSKKFKEQWSSGRWMNSFEDLTGNDFHCEMFHDDGNFFVKIPCKFFSLRERKVLEDDCETLSWYDESLGRCTK